MPLKIFLTIAALGLLACHTQKPMAAFKQGIAGLVTEQKGNQMPSPGRTAQKPRGIKCDLYIYQATGFPDAVGNSPAFSAIKTKLITVVHTDSNGHYAARLPEGKYSVFIKDGEKFYADESDGSGILNPVAVTSGKITERNWVLRSRAVY